MRRDIRTFYKNIVPIHTVRYSTMKWVEEEFHFQSFVVLEESSLRCNLETEILYKGKRTC
jgi:hypothetical protein